MNMFVFFIITACAFVTVSSGVAKGHAESDYEVSETHIENIIDDGGIGKVGYSAGSGLRTIAQGSAEQAHNAVANQHIAGRQAAFVAKSSLAQAAAGASATAQAALVGKYILVQRLEREVQEAHEQLQSEIRQLQLAQRSTAAAQEAAQQAQQQVNAITAALNSAQGTAVHATQAADDSAAELASQIAMVGQARNRLGSLSEQLHAIQVDLQATQAAAQQAAAAAQIAQSNAAHAGASASAELAHGGGDGAIFADGGYDGHY